MKEILSVFQNKGLEQFGGLWTIFEKLGSELGNTIGNGIDRIFDALEEKRTTLN